MARTVTPIDSGTDTFETWVTQTNTVIDYLAAEVLTANNNANGGFVTGNSQLFGNFTANVVAVYNELRGGNIQSSAALTITSQLNHTQGTITVGVDDTTPGIISIYGGGSGEISGELRIFNNADDDTNADYWRFYGEDGTGDLIIGDPGADALRIDETTFAATFLDDVTANDFIAVDLPTPTNYTAADDRLTTHLSGIDTALGTGGGAELNANNTHDATYYVGLSSASTGSWTNAVVATTKLYFNPADGELSATDFNTLSDVALKENINLIPEALNKVKEISGVQFNWKENNKRSAGVIAQEIKKILPELVTENNTVKFVGIIGLLVEAVKELDNKLEEFTNGKKE